MKSARELAFLAIMSVVGVSCNNQAATSEALGTTKPEWTRDAVIYEVNWRQFTDDGTLKSFEKELPYLKELGVDILWFMPINPISEVNRKGELGSYYASQNYTAINPEMGTIEDFKEVVKRAHEMDMQVIIDWVANHTGCDNVWLKEHDDWYKHDEEGNKIGQYDWTDTYKLDYDNPELRKAMYGAMEFWVKECDIDGFRCDVASLVPVDFWDDTRAKLEKIKPVFFLAESSDKHLCDHAFDMVYNWPLLFLFDEIAEGKKDCSVIDSIVKAQINTFAYDAYQMNHITNHDRNTWDGTEFERLGDGVKAFAALTYVLPGMPLIYTGQEVGFDHRYEFFKKDTPAKLEKNEWFNFYQGLNNLKHESKALLAGVEGGEWKVYPTSAPKQVLACGRLMEGEDVVYIGNLSPVAVKFTLEEAPDGELVNWFTGEVMEFAAGDEITLQPWEYMVLHE